MKATSKFPTWPTDPLHALAVLQDEANLAKRALSDEAFIGLCSDVMAWIGRRISMVDGLGRQVVAILQRKNL